MNARSHARVAALALGCAPGCGGPAGSRDSAATEPDVADTGETSDVDGSTGEPAGDLGDEQVYVLSTEESTPPPLELQMNREEVTELFGASAQDILLLEIDPTPLLAAALEQVRFACGDAWQADDPDPHHDCSLTPLGQTFQGADGTWQTSAEYSLVRLMTMTPANVVVTGTSSQGLQEMADSMQEWGFTDGYGQILADALGIARTDPVVSVDSLVEAFRLDLVASHPEVGEDAMLTLTLADALHDLETLTERYGPSGDHPGIVDPRFVVHGEVLGPDFRMMAIAHSNLRPAEGVDADVGKGFLSVVVDETGPTWEDELELDFEDPDAFRLEGIVDDPRVDLRFSVGEHVGFVPACTTEPACTSNAPGAPTDASSVWARDPWQLERALAHAARLDYVDRVYAASYAFGAADVLIGQGGNPPGWVQYDIWFDIGDPPEDQFLWETVLEVGQVALHATPYATFAEGDANAGFTLFDVPVGLSGPEAAEAVRPHLQAQAAAVSDFLLGDYTKNNDPVDFFVRRAEDGRTYAYFAAPGDRPEGSGYAYAAPGFFASPDLDPASKISSVAVAGLHDTAHEKLHLPVGETVVWFSGDSGEVYRARLTLSETADEVEAAVAELR